MTVDAIDLSLVIPAYNEAGRLPATLAGLRTFLATRPWRCEVVVADDGSTDATVAVAEAASAPGFPVRVVSLGTNQGKGAAVKRGMAEARGAFVAFVDADLPYAFDAFDVAMQRLAGRADLVIGGRDLPGSSEVRGYTWVRRLSGEVYSLLVNRLAVRAIPDTQCGFKWFRRGIAQELFKQVTLAGFAFDVELLVLAQRRGLCIDRIPVRLTHSQDSRMRLLRDSARMFRDLLRINRRLAQGVYDERPHPADAEPSGSDL
jgi:dolichyl-phosphate beta-glucosyltransferase